MVGSCNVKQLFRLKCCNTSYLASERSKAKIMFLIMTQTMALYNLSYFICMDLILISVSFSCFNRATIIHARHPEDALYPTRHMDTHRIQAFIVSMYVSRRRKKKRININGKEVN